MEVHAKHVVSPMLYAIYISSASKAIKNLNISRLNGCWCCSHISPIHTSAALSCSVSYIHLDVLHTLCTIHIIHIIPTGSPFYLSAGGIEFFVFMIFLYITHNRMFYIFLFYIEIQTQHVSTQSLGQTELCVKYRYAYYI